MTRAHQQGFSLGELLVSVVLTSLIVSAATAMIVQLSKSERTVWNRTQMHSSVRGATELLQQEVGQAGLMALPGPTTLSAAVNVGSSAATVSSTAGMFVGQKLLVDTGENQETVTLSAVTLATNQITASYALAHASGAALTAAGGFASGVVPPSMTNGSTGTVLKLYGDVNGDGNMVYVEYTCDTAQHRLSRNMVAWNAASKPAVSSAVILLSNIVANPNGTPCFSYQTEVVAPDTYVLDVAITLTVQTQDLDPITRRFQTETKTLLNVSPRNVFNVWEMASLLQTNRIQPMPSSIANLIR